MLRNWCNYSIHGGMNTKYLDLYTDYLAVTSGYATATGLSNLLDGRISHDKFTRFLSDGEWNSKDLWKQEVISK